MENGIVVEAADELRLVLFRRQQAHRGWVEVTDSAVPTVQHTVWLPCIPDPTTPQLVNFSPSLLRSIPFPPQCDTVR